MKKSIKGFIIHTGDSIGFSLVKMLLMQIFIFSVFSLTFISLELLEGENGSGRAIFIYMGMLFCSIIPIAITLLGSVSIDKSFPGMKFFRTVTDSFECYKGLITVRNVLCIVSNLIFMVIGIIAGYIFIPEFQLAAVLNLGAFSCLSVSVTLLVCTIRIEWLRAILTMIIQISITLGGFLLGMAAGDIYYAAPIALLLGIVILPLSLKRYFKKIKPLWKA